MLHWNESETELLVNPGPRTLAGKQNSRRILVLEDDLCLETMLTRIVHLIDPELETNWLTTGEKAIEDLSTKHRGPALPYKLFVADIWPPGDKSGLDFWKICRMRFPEIPFLFISSMPIDRFLRQLGSSVVCPAFLPKPFAVGEFRQVVEGLLNYAKQNDERCH
jgi:DNA-binding NtrC family response regulator